MMGKVAAATLLVMSLAKAACLPSRGDQIHGVDLAAAHPAFRALPPEQSFGYSPRPGARRVFRSQDLKRIAARFGLPVDEFPEICFEAAARQLEAPPLLAALAEALGAPVVDCTRIAGCEGLLRRHLEEGPTANAARIYGLEDYSHVFVPEGRVRFAAGAAHRVTATPSGALLLRGSLEYGEKRSIPLWARLRVLGRHVVYRTVRTVEMGEALREDHLASSVEWGAPPAGEPLTLEAILGREARRQIQAGEAISANLLRPAAWIRAGDMVEVRARAGRTEIRFAAKAATRAGPGETVLLINPFNGNKFAARASGPRAATVMEGGGRRAL